MKRANTNGCLVLYIAPDSSIHTQVMLDTEFKYYVDHQEELVKRYRDRYIVIRGTEVVGDYDTLPAAFGAASAKFPPGTFLIQHCTPGPESYTQHFGSRVAF